MDAQHQGKSRRRDSFPYHRGHLDEGGQRQWHVPPGRRLLEALQTSGAQVATPENRCPGKPVIVPPPKTADDADKCGSEGYETVDWYFPTKRL